MEKIIRCDRVRNGVVLYRVKGDRNILLIINRRYNFWIGLYSVGTAVSNAVLKEKFNLSEDEKYDISRY
jgi:hypothetical protein